MSSRQVRVNFSKTWSLKIYSSQFSVYLFSHLHILHIIQNKIRQGDTKKAVLIDRAPVAQLVERRAVTREVVSSTLTGPLLRVLK